MFQPNPMDPFTDPAWRHRRAADLAASAKPATRRGDDPSIRALAAFLSAWGRRGDRGKADLSQRTPEVAEAYVLFTSDCLRHRRWECEARLLARQADDEIAAACGMTAGAVRCYHQLFFEVRPRLDATHYVQHVILGGRPAAGFGPDDAETLLKVYGYGRGPRAVDDILRLFREPPAAPARLDGLDDATLKDLAHRLRVRMSVLTLTLPVGPSTPRTMFRLLLVKDRVLSGQREAALSGVAGRLKWLPTASDAVTFLSESARARHESPSIAAESAAAAVVGELSEAAGVVEEGDFGAEILSRRPLLPSSVAVGTVPGPEEVAQRGVPDTCPGTLRTGGGTSTGASGSTAAASDATSDAANSPSWRPPRTTCGGSSARLGEETAEPSKNAGDGPRRRCRTCAA